MSPQRSHLTGMDVFRNLPNMLSLARLCLVPVSIALISSQAWMLAFAAFVCAGVSDALDGWLAKRYGFETELGAYLDPLADKALLVSIYVTLALAGEVPRWLAILIVSRDLMIIGAVLMALALARPLQIRPLFISKLNTAAQIGFAGLVLGMKAFELPTGMIFIGALASVAILTLASMAAYLRQWLAYMSA